MKGILIVFAVLFVVTGAVGSQATTISPAISIAVHEPGTFGLFMAVSLILVIRRMNK